MDGDPAVEPELDTFSLFLPLPYRVAIVLVLGTSLAEALKFVLTPGRRLGVGAQPTLSFNSQDRELPNPRIFMVCNS